MTDWDIQPRAVACTGCQQPFADHQTYHTLLRLTADGYQRRDLCTDCYLKASRDGVFSYWQGEYKLPPPPPPEPIEKNTAESLLRQLLESADPAHAAARYILAVMLERKRILRHRDTLHEAGGKELLVYEHAVTGESFTVPDPQLRLDQLEQVQKQVAELLDPKKTGADPSANSAPSAS